MSCPLVSERGAVPGHPVGRLTGFTQVVADIARENVLLHSEGEFSKTAQSFSGDAPVDAPEADDTN